MIHLEESWGSHQKLTLKVYFNVARIIANDVKGVLFLLEGCHLFLLPGKCLPSSLPNLQAEPTQLWLPCPREDLRIHQQPKTPWSWCKVSTRNHVWVICNVCKTQWNEEFFVALYFFFHTTECQCLCGGMLRDRNLEGKSTTAFMQIGDPAILSV